MNEQMMQHGQHYAGQDVSGWIASEKFDGVRGYWDGSDLWTRGGLKVNLPDHWRDALPAGMALDCEVFAGYGNRQAAVNAVRYGRFADTVRLKAFDAPGKAGSWSTRMGHIPCNEIVSPVEFQAVENIDDAIRLMREVQAHGGEGLMLRHPSLDTVPGRTDLMLKLKYLPV